MSVGSVAVGKVVLETWAGSAKQIIIIIKNNSLYSGKPAPPNISIRRRKGVYVCVWVWERKIEREQLN